MYDLKDSGRNVAWAVTVYPYYYGTQDPSLQTLTGDVNEVLANLALLAPAGKDRLPLRVIESGWPSECSDKATPANHCTFAQSAFDFSLTDVKLYYFELQDFADGWSECEKHFGLYDSMGNNKCPSALPVNWGAFNAVGKDNKVFINWTITSTIDNKTFIIERSQDGVTFLPIGYVEESTHSNNVAEYEFIDANPPGNPLYYRIKQIDFTGTYSYSKVLTVSAISKDLEKGNFCRIFPNPVSSNCSITLQMEENANYELYSNIGKLIIKGALKKGSNVLSGEYLQKGIYHFVLKSSTSVQFITVIVAS